MFRMQRHLFIAAHVKGTSKPASQADTQLAEDLPTRCELTASLSRARVCVVPDSKGGQGVFIPTPSCNRGEDHSTRWQGLG